MVRASAQDATPTSPWGGVLSCPSHRRSWGRLRTRWRNFFLGWFENITVSPWRSWWTWPGRGVSAIVSYCPATRTQISGRIWNKSWRHGRTHNQQEEYGHAHIRPSFHPSSPNCFYFVQCSSMVQIFSPVIGCFFLVHMLVHGHKHMYITLIWE